MIFATILLAAISFSDSKTLAVQIRLDQAGYSCNTIDGSWGRKSQRALERYLADRGLVAPTNLTPETAFDRYFPDRRGLFREVKVTAADLAKIAWLPTDPAERAELTEMTYETAAEMFAERGHTSIRGLERLNPSVDWSAVAPGLVLKLPAVTPIEDYLAKPPRPGTGAAARPLAARLDVSLSQFEIRVSDAQGRTLALLPCSIARDKTKLPAQGELKVTTAIARPNYTYTAERTAPGRTAPARYVWPAGPNCPVGLAWLGLNLPTYGIHGTPKPETIGSAESHGCFRLSNWNAARLYSLCPPGAKVFISK